MTGLTATLVDVRATINPTQQSFEIPGATGYEAWPLWDRARAAVLNSAMTWPTGAELKAKVNVAWPPFPQSTERKYDRFSN